MYGNPYKFSENSTWTCAGLTVLLYECEAWKAIVQSIQVFLNKCLRWNLTDFEKAESNDQTVKVELDLIIRKVIIFDNFSKENYGLNCFEYDFIEIVTR